MAAAGSWRRARQRILPSMPGDLRSKAPPKVAVKNCSAATPAKPCSRLPRTLARARAECSEYLLVQVRLPSAPGCGTALVSSLSRSRSVFLERSPTPPPPSPFLSADRGGGAHAPGAGVGGQRSHGWRSAAVFRVSERPGGPQRTSGDGVWALPTCVTCKLCCPSQKQTSVCPRLRDGKSLVAPLLERSPTPPPPSPVCQAEFPSPASCSGASPDAMPPGDPGNPWRFLRSPPSAGEGHGWLRRRIA